MVEEEVANQQNLPYLEPYQESLTKLEVACVKEQLEDFIILNTTAHSDFEILGTR